MSRITVAGARYKVIENLGFQHSAGVFAKEVVTPQGARIAVRRKASEEWRWWTQDDRVQGKSWVWRDWADRGVE